jgi:hypothetical protein
MKILNIIIVCVSLTSGYFAQGIYNNGANIVFSGAAQMYINGVGSGHYLSATATTGSITASATSSITLLGNWTNNTTNKGFATPDGGGVVLAGNAQSIGGSAATAFYNLTLAGNGVKTLAVNSTTVGGQATFTGILAIGTSTLDLNSNRLDVTNSAIGAITSGAAGYILSETNVAVNPSIMRWYMRTTTGAHVYPFGVAGSKIPFTFNITVAMAGASDYIDVSTRATAANDNLPWAGASNFAAVSNMYSPNLPSANGSIPDVIDRWWDVTNSSAVTASLTFSYRGTENTLTGPNVAPAAVGAQYWDGAHWMPNNATYGSSAGVSGATIGSVTTPAVNKFCPWILSSVLNPLPIELLNFDVSCVNNKAKLEWCTASELNNHHFTIEYSIDGVNFEPIGTIAGSGTTEFKHCYSFIANSTIGDIGYYRLVQTDINGNSKTFNVVSLEACDNLSGNTVLTNNGTKEVGVLVNSLSDATIDLYVYNSLGQILEIKSLEIKKGYNTLRVNLNNVSNALYYISAYKGNVLQTSKKIIVSDIGN